MVMLTVRFFGILSNRLQAYFCSTPNRVLKLNSVTWDYNDNTLLENTVSEDLKWVKLSPKHTKSALIY